MFVAALSISIECWCLCNKKKTEEMKKNHEHVQWNIAYLVESSLNLSLAGAKWHKRRLLTVDKNRNRANSANIM